ncbi:MAG: GNA1162 family protein [Desulfovibrio sp.]
MFNSRCILILVILALLSGCAAKVEPIPKKDVYPSMYEEAPASILILPPINLTTAADAKIFYSTTIQEPLSGFGYYTFPFPIIEEILKHEGIYDTQQLYEIPVDKFKEYFGAEAVLFTKITDWDVAYAVIGSYLTVGFEGEIRSTTTNDVLWKNKSVITVDLSGGNSGGGLAGLLAKMIVAAINTAKADYVPYARLANYRLFSPIPVGKYHAKFGLDKEELIYAPIDGVVLNNAPVANIDMESNSTAALADAPSSEE